MDRQCSSCGGFCKKSGCERENVQPQRTWVGLTPEEVDSLANLKVDGAYLSVPDTIRQTDAKLKEKNT